MVYAQAFDSGFIQSLRERRGSILPVNDIGLYRQLGQYSACQKPA
jgi:hypothetical protein